MARKAKLGTVSRSTFVTSELIKGFVAELERIETKKGENAARLRRQAAQLDDADHGEEGMELLVKLIDDLNAHAPAYCYFGAHPADHSDFGFWVEDEARQAMERDGVRMVKSLDETEELPVALVKDDEVVRFGTLGHRGFRPQWTQ